MSEDLKDNSLQHANAMLAVLAENITRLQALRKPEELSPAEV